MSTALPTPYSEDYADGLLVLMPQANTAATTLNGEPLLKFER